MDLLSTSVLAAAIVAIFASLWRPIKDVIHSMVMLNLLKKAKSYYIEKELEMRLEQARHQKDEIQRYLESIEARTPESWKLIQDLQVLVAHIESEIKSDEYEKLIDAVKASQQALGESTHLDVTSDEGKNSKR